VPGRAVETLVQFARLVSDATASRDAVALLVGAIVDEVGCPGVAVVTIDAAGAARVAETRGLPEAVRDAVIEAIDAQLGTQILHLAGPAFAHEITRPLVAGGDLFGAVVMLCHAGGPPEGNALALAEGLVDLTAIALHAAAQLADLARSHAELRASQEMLVRSEKLRALGQMAAGVSHDLRNILNPLSLHLQLLADAVARGRKEDATETIGHMKQVMVRGLQTIDSLRDYGRRDRDQRTEIVDLDAIAREAVQIARPRLSSGGPLRAIGLREKPGKPPPVRSVAAELVSAVVNLTVNAIDAIGAASGKGMVEVRTGADDGGSWIEVADDGPGMPPEVEKRIFEPFFTTKGDEGTGLGLAMVEAAMIRLGGRITVQTKVGVGTTFRISLPGAEAAAPTLPGRGA
jgi:signal transduction histidine kinase